MVKSKQSKSKGERKSFLGYTPGRQDGVELKSFGNRKVAIYWRHGMPMIVDRESRYSPAGRVRSI